VNRPNLDPIGRKGAKTMSDIVQLRDYAPKRSYRRIEAGQSAEDFMASLRPGEIYEHPETLRLMVHGYEKPFRYPYD
jgi:hypothetical protein